MALTRNANDAPFEQAVIFADTKAFESQKSNSKSPVDKIEYTVPVRKMDQCRP